ncbi:mandelate racemase/muconate lactonizing enzyme family protein [Chungangia koreensis]|uniref:Dipeptide epimerase n=1 Tax=Chungangia koreensis TaxID=752657 RepID=A0ABV8X8E6_9LACT
MIIQHIETTTVAVPLTKPFKTALRTVHTAESVFVRVICDNGLVGFGEAPPTHVITGDSIGSIRYAIEKVIAPQLIGMDLRNRESVFKKLNAAMIGNSSVKAAVDMAIFDLVSQAAGMPLAEFLGGYRTDIETNFTVSVNSPLEMADDAERYISDGFNVLKIKVGIDDIENDINRISGIRDRIGYDIKLRLDANQGWEPKAAVRAIGKMEDAGLDIELIEQPVKAHDIEGLKYVTDHSMTPIMADESVFSPSDACRLLQIRAADLINIKLMKAGGIYNALKINTLAEANGIQCMTGSMIETKLGITAAAHFAASQPNITRYDFDAPLMLSEDVVAGGVVYTGRHVSLNTAPGLGLESAKLDGLF